MPRQLGPGGTQLPRYMGPPGPKMGGGGNPYACDINCHLPTTLYMLLVMNIVRHCFVYVQWALNSEVIMLNQIIYMMRFLT